MKHLKILGLAVVAAAALMAFVGASTASATVLCKAEGTEGGEKCGSPYPEHTKIAANLVAGTKAKLVTSFLTIECEESAVSGETGAEEAEPLTGPEGTVTFEKCNCEVKVLKAGTLAITHIAGTNNGNVSSNSNETTVVCSTIFGSVHCIYATSNTALGTLNGGNPAKLKAEKSNIPRLTTNSLCAEKSEWSAEYEVTEPKPLFVAKHK